MKHNVYIYILVMAAVIYLIRLLPVTVIRKKITNKTLKSFLYYVPYVTLAVMTFPDIINATSYGWSGALALVIGAVLAYFNLGLFGVAVSSCLVVFISELIMKYLF
ncbi:MAG: AzlD domain-containing protein [Clostridia bacterium]|nr:AzlD domain-containing protein [Clostridia bacterium]